MNRTAYLMAWFQTMSGTPVFKHLQILSEDTPTCRLQEGFWIPLAQASAYDFEGARFNLIDVIDNAPHLQWCKKHMHYPAPAQDVLLFSLEGREEWQRLKRVYAKRLHSDELKRLAQKK